MEGGRPPMSKDVMGRLVIEGIADADTLIKGDVVAKLRKLRQQPGRTLHTWGSTDLLQTLLKNDLIDVPPVRAQREAGVRADGDLGSA